MKTKEYRKQLAEAFIHVLEEKELDWKKEWQASGFSNPFNGSTGRPYRGVNRLYLTLVASDRGYQDPRWCTFYQIQENGWKLANAKGQGVKVEYWFPYDREERKSMSWEDFRMKRGEFNERYVLRASYKTVFNASLIDGIAPLPKQELKEISPDILIKKLSSNMGVKIVNDGGDSAFYRPSVDIIHLPLPEYFETEYAYDSTALHEIAHSTGVEHRLNRDLSGRFGTPEYAYEELVAEISSCFMSTNLHIEQSPEHISNHKAYVQSWIQAIREKSETLVRAVHQAEQTASYMEYQAGLISRMEYDKTRLSSTEVKTADFITEADLSVEKTEEVAPKKSREELNGMVREIKEQLEEIREDNQFFHGFIEKHGIPMPDERKEQKEKQETFEEYYVVEDLETGKTLTDVEGNEIRMENPEDAERIAKAMNREEDMLSMASELVKEYEQSIGRTDSVLDTLSDEQTVAYAAMCQKYLEFGYAVDYFLTNSMRRRETIKVCDTPPLFVKAGCKELPMHITQAHIRSCMHELKSGNVHFHGLTKEEIKRIPEALEQPVILAESLTRRDSIVAILDYREGNGLPVMVSIVPDGKATYQLERVDSNFITSVYGKDNFENYMVRMASQGKILYINKEKSEELALVPLQLRQGHLAPAYDCIIRQFGDKVNDESAKKAGGMPQKSVIEDSAPKISGKGHKNPGVKL